ncbi:MAG: PH domain-containing protein [Clostridium sp.]|uniref:PH domain-containing protein n=1 Tax=Clostridium sp. TaxID=1506 RepID=UPI0030479139
MNSFDANKKMEIIPTILTIVALNIVGFLTIYLLDSYLILTLIKTILLICNIFYLYHIGVWFTVKYQVSQSEIKISCIGGLKKVTLPIGIVESYTVGEGKIKGIALSGMTANKIAIGRIAIKDLGTTRLFVTNTSRIIYLKTKDPGDVNYAISPKDFEGFQVRLRECGIGKTPWIKSYNKVPKLYKERKFMITLFITSAIVLIITFTPLMLYILNELPDVMPLVMNGAGKAVEVGTDKQFAFSQMTYGLLNMAVLFCMYYAAHFCAKYDKKAAFRYMYISLFVAIVFLGLQIKLMTMVI